MRFMLLIILLFIYYGSVNAQSIFLPFLGEREIIKTADIKIKTPDFIKGQARCGNYFLYSEAKGYDGKFQKVVTFQVDLPESEARRSDEIVVIVKELLVIKLDNRLQIPTAQWSFNANHKPAMIIRISKKDLKAAACISGSP